MTLFVVRHGQTQENLQRILQGHLPGVLTEKGLSEMQETARRLAAATRVFSETTRGSDENHTSYDALLASDLARTRVSAQILASQLGMEVEPTPLLRERDWGDITGMPIAEARDRFRIDGQWRFPPTVETEDAMLRRAKRLLQWLRERRLARPILVTHGLFARYLIGAATGCQPREVTPLSNGEVRTICPLSPET